MKKTVVLILISLLCIAAASLSASAETELRRSDRHDKIFGIGSAVLQACNGDMAVGRIQHTSASAGYMEYIVVPGDTLYALSKRYNVSIAEIKSLSNIDFDDLRVAQKLKIPVSTRKNP